MGPAPHLGANCNKLDSMQRSMSMSMSKYRRTFSKHFFFEMQNTRLIFNRCELTRKWYTFNSSLSENVIKNDQSMRESQEIPSNSFDEIDNECDF